MPTAAYGESCHHASIAACGGAEPASTAWPVSDPGAGFPPAWAGPPASRVAASARATENTSLTDTKTSRELVRPSLAYAVRAGSPEVDGFRVDAEQPGV